MNIFQQIRDSYTEALRCGIAPHDAFELALGEVENDLPFRLDSTSWFYKNCKRQRKAGAKICGECPFRSYIENWEKELR